MNQIWWSQFHKDYNFCNFWYSTSVLRHHMTPPPPHFPTWWGLQYKGLMWKEYLMDLTTYWIIESNLVISTFHKNYNFWNFWYFTPVLGLFMTQIEVTKGGYQWKICKNVISNEFLWYCQKALNNKVVIVFLFYF